MKLQGIKTTIKRRSESPKAKRQQQDRRGESLFKKACEYSARCDAEVYLCVKIKRNGQIYFFNSEISREWLPLDEQMVGHSLSRPSKVFNARQERHYPIPIQFTPENLQCPKEDQKNTGKLNGSKQEADNECSQV
jgi:SRF-type transcription factor (DNA-binding and dimerisation domain)